MNGVSSRLRRLLDLSVFANAAIRALGLVSRFGLVLFIAKHMGAADLGRFGLIAGAVAMAPAFLGWGLNYHVGRALVSLGRSEGFSLLAARLVVTMASAGAAVLLFGLVNAQAGWFTAELVALLGGLVVLECFGLDVQMALINLGRNTLANVLLFVRSSAWAFAFCGLAWAWPSLASLEFLLLHWLVGLVVSAAVALAVLQRWRADTPWRFDWAQLREMAGRGRLVYFSDIAQVCVLYADRFVVGLFVTAETLGRYVLLWSIANAVFVLVQSAVLLPSLRRMVVARSTGGVTGWSKVLKAEVLKAAGLASLIALGLLAAAHMGLQELVGREFAAGVLMVLLLAANVTKVASDALGYGLYSLGADQPHMLLILAGAVVGLAMSSTGTAIGGVEGAGVGAVLTGAMLGIARSMAVRRVARGLG